MIEPIVLLVTGLVILLGAGEFLVRGAAGLARLANIPPLVIGLTVVAFGTSAPEFVVTLQAVLGDAAGIAMGNIVGSNIANVLLVLGFPAILMPITTRVPRLRHQAVSLLLATALFCGLVYLSGGVGTFEAVCFAIGMAFYFVLMAMEARQGGGTLEEVEELTSARPSPLKTGLLTLVGLVGLPLGATLLVDNGAALARLMGVRDEVIGLTVVAFGTSLPELATVLAAAFKRHAEVAVGSIIGSNVFNMLFVGAAAGFAGQSTFSGAALSLDIPVMIGATLLISLLIFARRDYGRLLGVLTTAGYIGYIVFLGLMGSV